MKIHTKSTKSLPLHFVIPFSLVYSKPVSDEADIFRLFLCLYPAAANIKDSEGRTPYDIAVNRSLDAYFLRLLLRADMTIDPQELFRLNYEQRRMALFISSGIAVCTSTNKNYIWRKLWIKYKDVLKIVVSYL